MTTAQIKIPNWLDFVCALPVLLCRWLRYGYSFRRIPLGEGRFALVDQQDYYWLNNFHWVAKGKDDLIYAMRIVAKENGGISMVRMHREIMGFPTGLLVDHRNNCTLDNRRNNLRAATSSQNLVNRRRDKSNNSSQYRGVCLKKHRTRPSAHITVNSKSIWLGSFDSEIDAARAYDKAAIKYHGEFARLNFPREDYANKTI
jgi:hypothetical protein